ncbi:MAG: DNA gyrase inhibitor YacG [Gammaproteobacteria bacterium]|nr:DNA gyrase inhibitor YacG [Gammaproteobacteria bacterium]MDE2261213.1 DNA gyrase inhibitor YacG [Gammaproteobacteria bacterium]
MAVQRVKCPTCQREIDWSQSPFRPFCSERCKLIDLGAWLTEKHAIPGEPAPGETTGENPVRPDESPRKHS